MELNSIADALSGLQSNQTYMDVVGNNISNVNTVGYKTQSVRFEDLMNQTLSYGTQAANGLEGSNPFQIGMGVGGGTMNLINTQGSVHDTGRMTDMAIQGNGYFILDNGQGNYFSRDGSFTVAPDGTLESGATGMTVQGWMSPTTGGTIDTTKPLATIKIPVGSQNATATTKALMTGNLDSGAPVYNQAQPTNGGQFTTSLVVYDSQGNAHNLSMQFQKQSANTWSWQITPTGSNVTNATNNKGTLTFDQNGNQNPPATPTINLTYANSTAPGSITVDFSKISQLAQTSQVNVATTDGTPGGTMSTFSVGRDGTVTAVYSNGTSRAIGQVALADFRNPDGLIRQGNNLYSPSVNSGSPLYAVAGVGNVGAIATGQLEGSNVDLAAQFGDMIQAQQGFNANTKVISTTNSLLQSVIAIVP